MVVEAGARPVAAASQGLNEAIALAARLAERGERERIEVAVDKSPAADLESFCRRGEDLGFACASEDGRLALVPVDDVDPVAQAAAEYLILRRHLREARARLLAADWLRGLTVPRPRHAAARPDSR